MGKTAPFRLNRSGLMLAVVSAAYAGNVAAVAGRVEFTLGGVTLARGGAERPLTRGTELDNGDTVRTNDGRVQIRFTDGAYVSLQPNTEYSIRDYSYGRGGEERGIFGLLKGAMRTVTGAIGRVNRDRYQITTPTATVGIRGTGGVIQVQDDGSTLVVGTSGIWSLTNPAGSVDVPAGTSAVAPTNPNQPPQESTQQPTSGPAPVPEQEPTFVAGEEREETGLPVIPEPAFTPLVSGPGYAAALAYTDALDAPRIDGGEFGGFQSVDAVFDGQGRLTSIFDPSLRNVSLDPVSGVHSEFGSDGILAWGRWTGTVHFIESVASDFSKVYGANEGFHYVVGLPTPVMPTQGSATYSLIGATAPTYANGSAVPGTLTTASLSVTFSSITTISGTFGVNMSDGKSWDWTISTSTSSAFFRGTASDASGTMTGTGCAVCGCNATVNGFFAGAGADRAGVSYHLNNIQGQVLGAAALKKD